MKKFVIDENSAGKLIKFIQKTARNLPASELQKALRKKRVKVNGARITDGKFVLNPGDVVELYINDEFFAPVKTSSPWEKVRGEISIVYEDDNILVADKPAGILCHEDERENVQTLLNLARKYVGNEDVALCHRLDRNTRGLVVCAKNAVGLREMTQIIRNRWVKKFYVAEVENAVVKSDWVTATAYLARDLDKKQVYVSDEPRGDAKEIITKYRFIGDGRVEIELVTGRTHQIRAHMAHLGYPLLGDAKYGNAKGRSAQRLEAVRMEFGEDIPSEFRLNYLRGRIFKV